MHSIIRRYLSVAALVGLTLAGSTEGTVAQTLERELYVSVVDRDGNPVAGLTPDNFIVREDSRLREVLRVGPATAPMQIALLVDTSQAASRAMLEIRAALIEFVESLLPGNGIALVAFGERPTIRVDETSSAVELRSSIERLFGMPNSGSYLLDAIDLTLKGFARRDARRPVMVVVTTRGVEYSSVYFKSVLRNIKETGTAFHAIVLDSEVNGPFDQAARDRSDLIDQGTTASGGGRHQLLTTMDLEKTLQQVRTDIANQYLVVYARPDTLIPPERIEVGVENPELTARGTPVRRADGS